jgi:predicted RNA binding protein YcfA (HicA-like mRNA interferase family)
VNYLVRRDSPLARRVAVGAMPIRYREVSRALTRLGCVFESSGRGSHEKWRSASGKMLTVPRHHGDLKTGTLKSIFRAAGHPMGVSEIRRIINDTMALEGEV